MGDHSPWLCLTKEDSCIRSLYGWTLCKEVFAWTWSFFMQSQIFRVFFWYENSLLLIFFHFDDKDLVGYFRCESSFDFDFRHLLLSSKFKRWSAMWYQIRLAWLAWLEHCTSGQTLERCLWDWKAFSLYLGYIYFIFKHPKAS